MGTTIIAAIVIIIYFVADTISKFILNFSNNKSEGVPPYAFIISLAILVVGSLICVKVVKSDTEK